mgnify:CR=1 FL=1
MPTDDSRFTDDYGDWALVAGGSDGLGAAFAHEIAMLGVNLVLVARRQGPLDMLAADLRDRYGVEVRTLSLDLGEADAAQRLDAETRNLKLGLVVFNAGSEASGALFHETEYANWQALIQRNILFLTEALHRFGARFRANRRGGLWWARRQRSAAGRMALYILRVRATPSIFASRSGPSCGPMASTC